MTRDELAKQLNGREYGSEITDDEEQMAKQSGLVVIFGYSDDNVELRGAINDEIGCYDGGELMLRKTRVVMIPDRDEREVLEKFGVADQVCTGAKIKAQWCATYDYSWTYETDVPHSSFDIVEDGQKYCRGIVISIDDLPA